MVDQITDNDDTKNDTLEGIKGLANVMKGLQETVGALNTRMDGIETTRVSERVADDEKAGKKPDTTDDQLEDMSRAEFMTHMITQISDTLIKPVAERIDGDAATARNNTATELIQQAADNHPDFQEFATEIKKIAREMPGISPERAYQMARSEDPDKSATMDEKYETDEQKKVKADAQALEEANSGDAPFGGLAPTSGVLAEKVDFKDNREAFDDAWKTHVTDEGLEGAFRT